MKDRTKTLKEERVEGTVERGSLFQERRNLISAAMEACLTGPGIVLPLVGTVDELVAHAGYSNNVFGVEWVCFD